MYVYRERDTSFDFKNTIIEYIRYVDRNHQHSSGAAADAETDYSLPVPDSAEILVPDEHPVISSSSKSFALQEGQTIKIKLHHPGKHDDHESSGNSSAKKGGNSHSGGGGGGTHGILLPKPKPYVSGSTINVTSGISTVTPPVPASADLADDDFDEFVSA